MTRTRSRARGAALLALGALLVLVVGLVVIPAAGRAQVPRTIGYQGALSDAAGAPVSGLVAMTFSLWDAPDPVGATLLWQEGLDVTVTNGAFQVLLGADGANPLPAAIFESPLWLGIAVGGDAEMTPRQALAAVGYAVRAKSVEVDTLSALGCTGDEVAKWNGAAWVCAADADTQLNEGEVETFVTNDALDLAAGSTLGGAAIQTGSDADTLAGLGCTPGQIATWNGSAWVCVADADTQLNEGEVETFVTNDALDLAAGSTLGGAAIQTGSDADTLAGLGCMPGQIASWNGAAWVCAADANTQLNEGEVETFVTNDALDLAAGSSVAGQAILTSVDWAIVTGIPAGLADGVDDDALGGLGCPDGQVAKTSGGVWTCAADEVSGGLAADLGCTGCVSQAELNFDTATQAELNAHGGDSVIHHVRYTDAEAKAAVGEHVTSVDGLSGGTIGGAVTVTGTVNAGDVVLSGGLKVAGELTSTLTRDPPLTVASSALVANLNADRVDGLQAAEIVAAAQDEMRTAISVLPFTIGASGSYYLTGDLTLASTSANGITVNADNVTIDLMGFSIIGPGTGTGNGIYMNGRRGVALRNGTVRGFGETGILEFSGGFGRGHRIVDVRALDNGEFGIYLIGAGHLVKDCTTAGNGSGGIQGGTGSTVTGNTAHGNSGTGISTFSGTVFGNTASQNTSHGILAYDGSTVTGNTAYLNGANGILAYDGSTVTGNTARRNGGSGIYAHEGSTVTGNAALSNDGAGIVALAGTTVINNTARLNDNQGISLQHNSLVDGNTAYDNDQSFGGFVNIDACPSCTFGINHAPP